MSEQRVEKNKLVTFTYVIQNEHGEILEQSDIPLGYLHDKDDRMFPKVIREMEGHAVGDTVEVTLPPEEGFGERDPSLTYSDQLENVPLEFQQIGAEAVFRNDAGETVTMRVTSIENGIIMLDGNPPFAGKTVVFKIKITGIRDATEQEVGAGQPADQMQMPSLH